MFSVRSSVLIALLLLLPLYLAFKYGGIYEPFPAVLMPSGAHKTEVPFDTNETEIKNITVKAINRQGNWQEVDRIKLLHPIPVQYFPPILSRSFGLSDDYSLKKRGKFEHFLSKIGILRPRVHDASVHAEAKAWLREQLIAQQLKPDTIKVSSFLQIISLPEGSIVSEIVKNEAIYALD